ncbi:MAG TPA: carbohydrate ABC transporter permease [Paenibacillus sp.]
MLHRRKSFFSVINAVILALVAALCVLPMVHILAVSFSDSVPVSKYEVGLVPKQFTLVAYQSVFEMKAFWKSFGVTLERVVLGVSINMLLTIMLAYPLSKESRVFPGRSAYVWLIVFTMLFNGGLVPTYMVIKNLGLIDTIWALVLPVAVPVFNVILMMNFFRQIPKELEESFHVDGASHWKIMLRLMLPLSLPVIATVTLFSIVFHWNSWFDGLLYMSNSDNYPMQTYLNNVLSSRNIINVNQQSALAMVTNRSVMSAQIILASLPILIVYPFLQKYFVHGIVMGSVKG